MRMQLSCWPCFTQQIVRTCQNLAPNPKTAAVWARSALRELLEANEGCTPPVLAGRIHARLRELSGQADPLREVKRRHNAFMRAGLEVFRARIAQAADPVAEALRLAMAGNVIDLGIHPELSEQRIQAGLAEAEHATLDPATLELFKRDVAAAQRILYLGDNAGEIVLDRLLVEQLPRGRVTFVVRGAPILNDATAEDAAAAGLPELAEVIANGTALPGTDLEGASPEFRRRWAEAHLVISKGQGNYETLTVCVPPIYFLLKAKCATVAAELGVPEGTLVFRRASGRRA